jgi:2-amino-4-hydroxy-6-hydroxymethyldihydropteridine diphosphokinase
VRVVIGIGANLGDRLATMRAAVTKLRAVALVEKISRVFATAPIGPPQPDYLNAAALVIWNRPIRELLDLLLQIEAELGRVRRDRWQARTIDLDILWSDDRPFFSDDLTIPHPRLHERAFAILPLLDVAPDAPYDRASVSDQTIAATNDRLD